VFDGNTLASGGCLSCNLDQLPIDLSVFKTRELQPVQFHFGSMALSQRHMPEFLSCESVQVAV
jgi:hypothetical protein